MRFGVDAAANAEGAYAGGLMCCDAGDGPVGVLRGVPWCGIILEFVFHVDKLIKR